MEKENLPAGNEALRVVKPFCCRECGENLALTQLGIFIELPGSDGKEEVCIYDILCIEADDNSVHFYIIESRLTEEVKTIKVSCSLARVERMKILRGFMRVHRSFMVNLLHVSFRGADRIIRMRYLPKLKIIVSIIMKPEFDAAFECRKI